jgi:uncharacterized protein (DUF4415 family)
MTAKKLSTDRDWSDADDAPDLSSPKYRIKIALAPVKRGRPKLASPKKMLSLRLDQEVIDSLRASGPGWQRRANDMLRNALKVGVGHTHSF